MAAKQQLLEQLVDIAEPAYQLPLQIPAGAYILLVIAVGALAYTSWAYYKRWRYLAAKRQALALLNQLEAGAASQINQLLKRVIKHYAPAHPALTASTAQWQIFLQQQLPAKPLPLLTELLYQAGPDNQQNQQFYQFAQRWLQQLQPATLADSRRQVLAEETADV
ncbi:protein of unknown function [Arsukibacterium tuosuense]|uniref:DUF4381 domain-containing protein n=1 Tax=Arsukibacterium tuosuense TaxID=1323745 RepID=A0A285IU42_9GAMM|nr:DUF4381 domain-containing protein [Arsukibacterium tuosuense]SNY51502.1 protein of unknown function [Arsukibacterium tuosuense]